MEEKQRDLERRVLGSTGEELSVIGFGGVIVTNTTPQEAEAYVAEAFDRGVTYYDVSPFYGNAQERLGPALAPFRDDCFLACKTRQRDAAGAEKELEESLRLLKTDHVDLYQFHSITEVARDVDGIFSKGGAMETFLKARDAGKIRFIGFSAHSEEAAHAAMDRFDFDSILFPLNFFTWTKEGFGPSVLKRAREKGMGVLALKAAAYQTWPKEVRESRDHCWPKCWYEPLEERDKMALALRFTLGLPVDAAIPPGHWELFKMALDIVQSGECTPLEDGELGPLREMLEESYPLFKAATA